MRKPTFCICENKAVDQLCGKRTADHRVCFRYRDSTTPLLPKSNRKAMNSNWSNQKANPALKTKAGKNKYYK